MFLRRSSNQNELQRRGIAHDVIAYFAAMNASSSEQQQERTLPVLRHMQRRGIEHDVVAYFEAINAISKEQQTERTVGLSTM